jgi:hypothetical protein
MSDPYGGTMEPKQQLKPALDMEALIPSTSISPSASSHAYLSE